ncbi:hypothetical protein PV325_013076 [Microctonus aethiopoides]|nr:hypothetical protein PV325_013076 [Microctonus aethiopoides]
MDYMHNHSVNNGYQSPSPETCLPRSRLDRTNIPDFYRIYAGIPANLLLNLIGFLSLVILFGLLRKKAWNYGRLALLHKTDNKWMELFYGDSENPPTDVTAVEASVNSQLSQIDRGFLSWIITAFRITDKELLRRAGPDGLLYISFQRHLIILTSMMTAVSLSVALPINYSGNMHGGNDTFSLTTMSNVDPMSSWIWVYTIIILAYLPIGCYVMRRFIKQVREARPSEELAARTLLISEIPKHQCNAESLMEYFKEAFPTLTVEDVTLAHDIRRLSALESQRDCAEQARLYCENYNKKKGALKLYPYFCGQVIGCCCNTIDALEFYTVEEVRLTALTEEEKKAALSRPLGIAFVTLGTPGAAKTMRRQLRSAPTIKWIVDYSPAPSDIFWENLSIPRRFWYFTAFSVNSILFFTLFFLTTPAVIVTALNLNRLSDIPEIMNFSPMIGAFLPTVLLVGVAALMPVLVARSESLVRHWTRSGLNRAVMTKTLLFLLLMVLILPSLGLTSVQAVLNWKTFENNTSRWECIFLADQGAIFVNYVITAALLGSALELVRFPELAILPCPLITPFGVLYMLVKHLVDRHNLCFAYGPSVGGGQLASAAAGATGAAPVLAQAALLALGLVRRGLSPLAALQLSGLAASILGLVTGATFPASKPKVQTIRRDFSTGQNFVAPVLRKQNGSCITEETLSVCSNSEITLSTDNVSPSLSLENSPKLYQDYGRNSLA